MKKTKPQLSYNAQRLKTKLESLGHTGVKVYWERLAAGPEMCGHTGGWFFKSDQYRRQAHLGNNIAAALAWAEQWHRVP